MKNKLLIKVLCLLLFFGAKVYSQDTYCRVSPTMLPMAPQTTSTCRAAYESFTPNEYTDTCVVNLAVYVKNAGTASNALINTYPDSTFQNWVKNASYLYGHIQLPVFNVGSTPYISDTKIRFRLVGIYKDLYGTPLPSTLNAIKLVIYAGADGNGANDGFAAANSNYIDFNMVTNDFNNGPHISQRYAWLGHELGHVMGLLHPDGQGYYFGGCNCGDDMFDDTYYPDCGGPQCGTNVEVIGYHYPNGPLSGDTIHCGLGIVTNNIMGYTCQNYFSPKQMAFMRHTLNTKLFNYCDIIPQSSYCGEYPNITTTINIFSNSHTISNTRIMQGDIVIKPGNTLLITGCVYMPPNSRIIVNPGAKLIVDGGFIGSSCYSQKWAGIEVQGTYNKSQDTIQTSLTVPNQYQGVCVIKNGTIISKAICGVFVGGRNTALVPNSLYAGGILQVENSYFIDCARGLHFYPYTYSARKGTKSYVLGNEFKTGNVNGLSYNIGLITIYDYAIYIDNNARIEIKNNKFQGYTIWQTEQTTNNTYNVVPETSRGNGINAINSDLDVKNNLFQNLRFAIKSVNNYSFYKRTNIVKNKFIDNLFGLTGNFSYATIDTNSFTIPQGLQDTVNIPLGSSKYPYGIYLDNSNTFKLQCDSFITIYNNGGGGGTTGESLQFLNVTAMPPLSSYGLIVKNSGNIGGEVKGNCYFGGLNIATQTEQNNPNLQIRCNKYENNTLAWRVNPQSATGVLGNQGTSCGTGQGAYRANNTFLGCIDNKDKFESYLSTPFNYFYWNNIGDLTDEVFKPCTTAVNNNVNLNPCNAAQDDPSACPAAPVNLVQLKEIREQVLLLAQKEQYDEAANYLLNFVNDDEVKKLLISYYYEKGDFQNMQQLLAQLVDNKQEKKQFKKLFHILKLLKQQDKDIKQLSNPQKSDIRDIALTETQAGAFARSILDVIGDKENNINPEVPFTSSSSLRIAKTIEEPIIKDREAELGQNIPNPASNSTLINLYVPEKSITAKVIVLNSLGQLMFEKTLSIGEQQINISTSDFNNGIYFYTMYVDDKAIASKRMVIVK